MADEWWNSAACARRTGAGADASSSAACSTTAPATGSAASRTTSMSLGLLQHGFPDDDAAASSSSSSFLPDPHLDWTMQAFMGGKLEAAAEGATSFNALLQLQGAGASHHHFLLDDQAEAPAAAPDPVPAAAPYGAVVAASTQHGETSLYADSQYGSGLGSRSYGDVPAAAATTTNPFSQPARLQPGQQQQQQQFPGFFSSPGLFGAPDQARSPQILLQALEHKPLKSNTESVQDACSSSVTRRSTPGSPAAVKKKPRIETPSPLPTFKVRKEKLGDRITALQQLVSPFGKTDTASVLHEAIEYIKFLHDQVASLSSPYLRCRRPVQLQHQQGSDKDGGEAKEDLRSRGLCLVPVASTYMVASETAPEFWHPTFGGTFR